MFDLVIGFAIGMNAMAAALLAIGIKDNFRSNLRAGARVMIWWQIVILAIYCFTLFALLLAVGVFR